MKQKHEAIVGLVVIIALIILVFGIIWGRGAKLFDDKNQITVNFENVSGLQKEDPVVVRGIEQGAVEDIRLISEYVQVVLGVNTDVFLSDELTVTIENKEIMGGKQVSIDPGKSDIPADLSKNFQGIHNADLNVVFEQARNMISRTDSLIYNLGRFLAEASLNKVLENTEKATEQAAAIVTENRMHVKRTIISLEDMLRQFKEDSTIQHFSQMISSLQQLTPKLNETVDLLNKTSKRIEGNEGTLGHLVHDKALYLQLVQTSASLDSLLRDLKENPKKYVHFSLF